MENPYNSGFIDLSFIYANIYKKSPAMFIGSFIKFNSIKTACDCINNAYRYQDALPTGKDFSEYCDRQPIDEKNKRVLNITLQIIYSLIK